MRQKVLLIVGPTAVGKTALSLELAQAFNGQIISGDSMQVYRGLDIGTAKATAAEQAQVKHHLIDILDPAEPFSVAAFIKECQQKIEQIARQAKLPIIVGGTGFYLQALLDNFQLGGQPADPDPKIRQQWRDFAAKHGQQQLWEALARIDPTAAQKIPPANQRRVIRALEVYQLTGEKFSCQADLPQPKYDPLILGLNVDRQLLYQRINQRVDLMLKQGLLPEARWLFDQGGTALPAGKGIGYKELFPYFAGQCSLETAVEEIKKNSRHYAKRQLTWFRNKMSVTWLDPQATDFQEQARQRVNDWLNER
ncbi:MAG: tRNA (adenosine(37)-N6)-dimethylallyltransferase MiaA [Liquorilactobacillus ghanensis]|uniref:tRNA (adenosine(37)-N6)-dimethylallyltransferase MiaA n=1 Tax=Liquorilactobacillus ghanensis TaxID=399370 RepID=UPI0039ECB391